MSRFAELSVSGDASCRGAGHGEAFRERIRRTIDFYLDELFADVRLSRAQLVERAGRVRQIATELAPAVAAEIDGIATGAGIDAWQIHLLNARTEILNARIPECTALFFAETAVLAQNWDWLEALESDCVVIQHERPDGHRYIAFGEPGMVGKVGFSSAGVGVCLNILFAPHDLSGLPVHMLIGALLNAPDYAAALRLLDQSGLGKASHLLVASGTGEALSTEFFGDERHQLVPREGVLLHTNHCLAHGPAGRTEELANSCARYDYVAAAVSELRQRDGPAAQAILSSTEGGDDALLRRYSEAAVFKPHRVGTCATVIMELAEQRMHLRRGPQPANAFTTYALSYDQGALPLRIQNG